MLEIIEEMEDIKAYKKAKKAKSEWLSFEEAFAEIERTNNKQMYKLVIEKYALKQLAKITPSDIPVIKEAIALLASNPRPK